MYEISSDLNNQTTHHIMTKKPAIQSAGLFAAALAICFVATGCLGKEDKQTVPLPKDIDKPQATEKPAVAPETEPAAKPEAKPESKPEPAAQSVPRPPATSGFDKTLKLEGISYHVQCPNAGSLNDLTITPSGLERDNTPVKIKGIDGSVTGAEVADLNGDGSPEFYVYVQSAGSGSYGTLIAYSANRKKSITPITLPELDKKQSDGYMGHDEFAIVESVLARRFPIYKQGDSNASPSGGTRQISYKLKAGEAGWLMIVDKVSEY